MKFAPLHVVTGYSFLQSELMPEKMAKALKEKNYFGMGISDNEVLYGAPSFVKMMSSINKPYVIGEEFLVDDDNISLYVISEEGYRNLLAINVEKQKGKLTYDFLKDHSKGLVAIIETIRGKFKELFNEEIDTSFKKYLLTVSSSFKDGFYLGLEVTSKEGVKYANRIRKFANEFTYECVAFPRIRYQKKEDAIVITMVEAIANDNKINTKSEMGQDYFMNEEDYAKIYSRIEMENTIKIIQESTFKFNQKRGQLIHYPVNNSKTHLRELCEKNLAKMGLNDEKHVKRLNYELDVISSMGYDDYFLIVQDFINFANNNSILVGPGRGSSAGSLVAYLLGITKIDPLDYDLQFERFLNPYRKTMPDIDVDFMDNKRDTMIQYMRDKYGNNRVANIISFQTIGAKQSLRDVGRIYDYPTHHIDLLSKRLTNKDYGLRESYKKLPDFRALVDSDKYFLDIVSFASKIEGLPRQNGLHAAGIILDDEGLEKNIPVNILMNDNYITQYEGEYLEQQGFLKMDFLALGNLTTINNCINLINSRHKDANISFNNIPFKEKEIFDLIRKGNTLGLFQIETPIMRKLIKVLKPTTFDDVVVLLALDRPGPMQYAKTYARRKEGLEKFDYISDDLKEILEPTYGIIIYQEQINSIATKMAGMSLAEADVFRRAISKKEKEKILGAQKQFIEGALKNGYNKEISSKAFNDILKFAEYGFNKSHSVVYSIITCRMAWLKAHYPIEFYTSLLGNSSASSDVRFNEYVSEMKSMGIQIKKPSINQSTYEYIIYDNSLLYPLSGIKEISINVVDKILSERKNKGSFTDFFDFALRMHPYKISESQYNNLISAGAFDEFNNSREGMHLAVKSALQYAELNYGSDGQLSIGIDAFPKPSIRNVKDDPLTNLENEYEVMHIMLSDNPLAYKKDLIAKNKAIPISEACEEDKSTIVGILKLIKTITTKKGDTMAFIKIYDESSEIELTIFPKLYKEVQKILHKNHILLVEVKKDGDDDEPTYIANSIKELEEEANV